jgi:hypothetical protein
MKKFMLEDWDRYRDLDLVLANPMLQGAYSLQNTLNIDSDSEKVQLFLQNSIVSEPYLVEDIQNLPVDGVHRDSKWHENHMRELTEFIIKLADEADSVPKYLAANDKFKPKQLLPDFSGKNEVWRV